MEGRRRSRPVLTLNRRLLTRGLERDAEDKAALHLRRNLSIRDHGVKLLRLGKCRVVDFKGERLPHRLTKRLVRGLRRVVVKLQRALHRINEPAQVLPAPAGRIVSGHLNLLCLLLGQNGVAPKARDERLRTALHQIDLCTKTCMLRHLFSRPPDFDFLTAVLLGDGLHNTSREPMCQLCPLRTCKLLGPNLQGDKKGGHLAARAWDYPASRCLKLNPHDITPQHRSEERRVGKECRSRWWPCP